MFTNRLISSDIEICPVLLPKQALSLFLIFKQRLFPTHAVRWEYAVLLGPSVIICDILWTTKVGYTTTRRTLERNLIDFYLVDCPGVAVNEYRTSFT